MSQIDFTSEEQEMLMSIVASVLHLGRIKIDGEEGVSHIVPDTDDQSSPLHSAAKVGPSMPNSQIKAGVNFPSLIWLKLILKLDRANSFRRFFLPK